MLPAFKVSHLLGLGGDIESTSAFVIHLVQYSAKKVINDITDIMHGVVTRGCKTTVYCSSYNVF